MRSRAPAFAVALALVLGSSAFLAACDAAPGEDVDNLLTDARLARQAGDFEEAVALLEEAYALDPARAAVRTELSATYLQRDGIDLLDVDRMMLFLTGTAPAAPHADASATAHPADPAVGAACIFEQDPWATPFVLSDAEGYAELLADEAVVEDAQALLHDAPEGGAPVMPAALRAAELCGTVVDGQLKYDRETALADLRASGLTDDEIASALAVNGVTLFLQSYFLLSEAPPEQTTWYHLANGAIGVCTEDRRGLRAQAEAALTDLFEALASLDLRAELLGDATSAREIVDHGIAAYQALGGFLGPACGG